MRDSYNLVKQKVKGDVPARLIETVLSDMGEIDHMALPHCFVHGDLVKSNVLVGEDDKIHIVDFSVSNWYPRIQELAVIVGNLMNEVDSERTFLQMLHQVVAGYTEQGGELTEAEMEVLPTYTQAAYASEYIGALKERLLDNNQTEENEYWMKLGFAGLHRSFE